MSDRLARSILWSYRWLGWAAYPLVGGYIGWRAAKGKEIPAAAGSATGSPARPVRTARLCGYMPPRSVR